MLQKELPGVMEAARSYGQSRTPYAMLSRGIAGIIDQTLILNIPGSTQGAKETLAALFPSLFHIFQSLNH
jgi:molybdopterin biosynthesis enzyme MoaB